MSHRGRPILGAAVGLLGITVGTFSGIMFFYAIPDIPYVLFHDNGIDFPGDLFELILFLLIGTFCGVIAIRWCIAARRLISGKHCLPPD